MGSSGSGRCVVAEQPRRGGGRARRAAGSAVPAGIGAAGSKRQPDSRETVLQPDRAGERLEPKRGGYHWGRWHCPAQSRLPPARRRGRPSAGTPICRQVPKATVRPLRFMGRGIGSLQLGTYQPYPGGDRQHPPIRAGICRRHPMVAVAMNDRRLR